MWVSIEKKSNKHTTKEITMTFGFKHNRSRSLDRNYNREETKKEGNNSLESNSARGRNTSSEYDRTRDNQNRRSTSLPRDIVKEIKSKDEDYSLDDMYNQLQEWIKDYSK